MALPTADELKTMDYGYQAQPFVEVAAKADIDLVGMDYAWRGEPFVGRSPAAAGQETKGNVATPLVIDSFI